MIWRPSQHAISDDQLIARYAHVLGEIPSSVADKAYAAAFDRLPESIRRALVGELRTQLPGDRQGPAPDDPHAFSVLMRDLHARIALITCRNAGALALAFVMSRPVAVYYASGAGSLSIDHQPPWVHDLAGHETAPIDGGTSHHGKGAITGEWYS